MKKRTTTAKKSARTKPAAKARPAAKASAKKTASAARKALAKRQTGPAEPAIDRSAARYTPSPIEGVGWKPFRYPPQ